MDLEILLKNSEEWFKHYKKLTQDERYMLLKETFSSSISDEMANEIDFVDLFISFFDVLKRERQFGKMSELYDVIYPQKPICGENFFYVDKALIDFYFFCAEPDKIKQHLESFKEYPVNSIDALINVFKKLVFYNYTDIALDVAKSVHPIVANSDKLIPGAEMEFEDLIYMEQMQEIYQTLKAGGELNRTEIIQNLGEYGIDVKKKLGLIEEVLSPEFNNYPDKVEFNEDRGRFIFKMLLLFAKYMFDEKNVSFPAASSIWYGATNILLSDYDDTEDIADFDDIFTLSTNVLKEEIVNMFGFLSENSASAYSLAWGMRYFYDFFKKYDYISDSVHIAAIASIAGIQAEIVASRTDELWEYDFVHRWVKPDSLDEQEFIREKDMFEHTFRNKTEIAKKRSAPVKKQNPAVKNAEKIGRNDPCPCGSGKKYKKCCEGNKLFS